MRVEPLALQQRPVADLKHLDFDKFKLPPLASPVIAHQLGPRTLESRRQEASYSLVVSSPSVAQCGVCWASEARRSTEIKGNNFTDSYLVNDFGLYLWETSCEVKVINSEYATRRLAEMKGTFLVNGLSAYPSKFASGISPHGFHLFFR